MWKNIVVQERSEVTIRPMRISRCLPEAANTDSEYIILIAFPLQQSSHELAS